MRTIAMIVTPFAAVCTLAFLLALVAIGGPPEWLCRLHERRDARWISRNRPFVDALSALDVAADKADGVELARHLRRHKVPIENIAVWAPLGALASVETWKRVQKSGITLEEARRWTTAGLDANFAAAAAQCDAPLTDVLELVEAYQAGLARTGQPPAELSDLWWTFCEKIVAIFAGIPSTEMVLANYARAPRQEMLANLQADPAAYRYPIS